MAKYRTYLCFGYVEGVTPLVATPATTPECEPHTPRPEGYLEHSEWADEMAKTHEARQCKGCGLWAIWEPKPPEGASAGTTQPCSPSPHT